MIVGIQTFGELIHFHPHFHALVTDGAFTPGGGFLCLPPIDKQLLRTAWEDRVFELYVSEGLALQKVRSKRCAPKGVRNQLCAAPGTDRRLVWPFRQLVPDTF